MRKTILRAGILALLLLSAVLLLVACGGTSPAETTATPTTAAPETTAPETTAAPVTEAPVTTVPPTLAGLSSYTIVYPTDPDEEVFRALLSFREALLEETGIALSYREDFVKPGQTPPGGTPEILIDITNREESRSHRLLRDDYGIYYENGRLVIAGGSPTATLAAIEKATQVYLHDGALHLPPEPDIVRGTYPYASATLFGVDLYDYSIVYDSKTLTLATALRSRISDACGVLLPLVKMSEEAKPHEILVGNFRGDRATTAVTEGYIIEQLGTRLSLRGAGDDGNYAAVMAFAAELAGAGDTLALVCQTPKTGSAPDMSLYTLNLPEKLGSMQDKYDIVYNADTVLDRFLAAREELPSEVTVVECVTTDRYPLSATNTLFVSPDGNDAAKGTKEDPLATLAEAVARMELKKGGVIFVRGGRYVLSESVTLTNRHSGTRQFPLFIKAYEEEEVTLTSNRLLDRDGWQPINFLANDSVYDRIPEAARDYILYTSIADQGLTDADIPKPTTSGPPSLTVDGEEYTLARFPNETIESSELLYFTHAYDTGTVTARDGSDLYFTWVDRAIANGWDPKMNVGWEVRVLNRSDNSGDPMTRYQLAEEILSWVNTGDIWYYGSTFAAWEFGYYNLALYTEGQYWAHNESGERYDPERDDVAYLGTPKDGGYYSLKSMTFNTWGCKGAGNKTPGRNTFILFNAVEALDAPGEWFYDKETGYLYIYPEEAHGELYDVDVGLSSADSFALISATGTSHLVLDGLTFAGSSGNGLYIKNLRSAVIQNCTFRDMLETSLYLIDCYDTAVIYSDFSAGKTTLLTMSCTQSALSLTPTGNVVQNCFFHDPAPLEPGALSWSGCRTVISHNYFNNTTTGASFGVECIIEYNRFEGGSRDVTDGGMLYVGGSSNRANHLRYNFLHMFNFTHQAVYNDTMGSGNYMYGNVVSLLYAATARHKPWYSSTGWGNVSYGNITILRRRIDDGAADDNFNESALFYYYAGDEYALSGQRSYRAVDYLGNPQKALNANGTLGVQRGFTQSEAGHWWTGIKDGDINRLFVRSDLEAWQDRAPEFVNLMYGTKMLTELWAASRESTADDIDYHIKYFYAPWYLTGKEHTFTNVPAGTVITIPTYQYIDGTYGEGGTLVTVPERTFTVEGEFTLTYEELASMERARRAPMYCVVKNNVILGGATSDGESPYVGGILTNSNIGALGYTPSSKYEHNFMAYLYESIMPGAKEFDYTLTEDAFDIIAAAGTSDPALTVEPSAEEELRYAATVPERAGFSREFDYDAWFDAVYPNFSLR